jgi:hypothetical protein
LLFHPSEIDNSLPEKEKDSAGTQSKNNKKKKNSKKSDSEKSKNTEKKQNDDDDDDDLDLWGVQQPEFGF